MMYGHWPSHIWKLWVENWEKLWKNQFPAFALSAFPLIHTYEGVSVCRMDPTYGQTLIHEWLKLTHRENVHYDDNNYDHNNVTHLTWIIVSDGKYSEASLDDTFRITEAILELRPRSWDASNSRLFLDIFCTPMGFEFCRFSTDISASNTKFDNRLSGPEGIFLKDS